MTLIARVLQAAATFARAKTPLILQTEVAECGLACLAMVAGRYGHHVDLPLLRRHLSARGVSLLSARGVSLHDLVQIASTMRLATRVLRAELEHLPRLRVPCILHWDHNHFVVLTRVGRGHMIVHDPAVGRRHISMQEVGKRFTGIVLEAWPSAAFDRHADRARVRIWDLLRHNQGFGTAAAQLLVISLILAIIGIAIPIAFQLVLDDVVVVDDRELLLVIALGVALVIAFRALMEFVRRWAIIVAGSRFMLHGKVSLFQQLLRLPLDFFERRYAGDIASGFLSIDRIHETVMTASILPVLDGGMAFALVGIMWLYEPRLALFALATTAIYAGARRFTYRLYCKANEQEVIASTVENSYLLETLYRITTIRRLPSGDRRREIWNSYVSDRISAELRVAKIGLIFSITATLLFGIDRIVIIFFGARAVLDGILSVGMLVAFIAYKDQFSERACKLLDTLVRLGATTAHAKRISDIALAEQEQESTIQSARSWATLIRPKPGIAARGINFRYSANEPNVIADFDLDVAPGECIAIVGPSGAGKTTLIKILAGFLSPTAGTILIDGIPIQAIGAVAYRAQIGCVLQDDRLLAGSIAENITAFNPSPDHQRIQQVAQFANIHREVVKMRLGYETRVGDMGASLSAGQVQLINLARALYRAPRILLLDEVTSAVDEENERVISEAISRLNITRIIATHRRSMFSIADRIVTIWPRVE